MVPTIQDGVYLQPISDMLTNETATIDYTADDMTAVLTDYTATFTIGAGTTAGYFSDATPVYTDVSTNLITSASGTYDPTAAANHLGTKSIVVGTRVAGTLDIIGAITTWTSTTLNSNGVVIYDDTHTSDHLFACVYFDGQVQSTSGDYAITLDANGFIQIDLVP